MPWGVMRVESSLTKIPLRPVWLRVSMARSWWTSTRSAGASGSWPGSLRTPWSMMTGVVVGADMRCVVARGRDRTGSILPTVSLVWCITLPVVSLSGEPAPGVWGLLGTWWRPGDITVACVVTVDPWDTVPPLFCGRRRRPLFLSFTPWASVLSSDTVILSGWGNTSPPWELPLEGLRVDPELVPGVFVDPWCDLGASWRCRRWRFGLSGSWKCCGRWERKTSGICATVCPGRSTATSWLVSSLSFQLSSRGIFGAMITGDQRRLRWVITYELSH